MLRASQAKNGVIDGNQEISRVSFKSSGQRGLAEIFNDVLFYESPELARRNPDAALATDYFC